MSEVSNISALNYLSSRLENSKNEVVDSNNFSSSNLINNKNENLELRIQNSDVSYLLLKDSVDQYTKISTIVEISNVSVIFKLLKSFNSILSKGIFDNKARTLSAFPEIAKALI